MLEFLRERQKEPLKRISSPDSSNITSDHLLKLKSVDGKLVVVRQDSIFAPGASSELKIISDSTGVCEKNNIYGTTYSDPGTFLTGISIPPADKTIINLAAKTRTRLVESKEVLLKHLKEGEEVPSRSVNNDWTLLILLVAAFLISLVRDASKGFKPVRDFFLFRGIKNYDSRDNDLFHWQATIQNLISFFTISLFFYKTASIFNMLPDNFNGLLVWAACLALVIILVTLRHIVCTITGNLSGQKEAFNEYLSGIYQSYHYVAVIYFFLVIFISYSNILPSDIFIIAGLVSFALIYMFRIVRLLIIFLNRNISIFYLILYLCALEILPVAITIRYFAGTARVG